MVSLIRPRQVGTDRLTTANTSSTPMDGTGFRPTDDSVRRSTLRVNERTARHSGFRGGAPRALDSQPERHVGRLHGLDDANDRRRLVLRDRGVAVDDEGGGLGVGQRGPSGPKNSAAVLDPQLRDPGSSASARARHRHGCRAGARARLRDPRARAAATRAGPRCGAGRANRSTGRGCRAARARDRSAPAACRGGSRPGPARARARRRSAS